MLCKSFHFTNPYVLTLIDCARYFVTEWDLFTSCVEELVQSHVVCGEFRVYRLRLLSGVCRGWWAAMAFLQRQERNKERSVLSDVSFIRGRSRALCPCEGQRPQRRVCVPAAGQCHDDVRLDELSDGVTQLRKRSWTEGQLQITLHYLIRRRRGKENSSFSHDFLWKPLLTENFSQQVQECI